MANEASFSVEDFLNAITTQLDRVQDALRVKALNRPLTYALKDLQLELKVFVELDNTGTVRFRPAGPNESGASAVQFAFTTITRPMIEENTISLASTRSAPLGELGLTADEQQRLERVGVRNLAQLNMLGSSTGVKTVARLSDISIDRLRGALMQGRPEVRAVTPEPPRKTPGPAPPTRPPVITPPVNGVRPAPPLVGRNGGIRVDAIPQRPVLRVAPNARRVAILGSNLNEGNAPLISLNAQPLSVASADDERIVVELPDSHTGGTLEVALDDGRTFAFDLEAGRLDEDAQDWSPDGDHSWP